MTRRDLAALVTVVVIAVPGLAVAQHSSSENAEVGSTEDVTEEPTEEPTDDETEDATEDETEDGALASTEGEPQEADRLAVEQGDEQQQEGEEVADEGHGELISTLARCLPSDRELHGTGLTRGAIISQVASSGEVTGFEGIETVETREEARALCAQVQVRADEGDAPDHARGRPDWAGPNDDAGDGDEDASTDGDPEAGDSRGRGSPPDHAGAHERD